jgi:hypothetical protein
VVLFGNRIARLVRFDGRCFALLVLATGMFVPRTEAEFGSMIPLGDREPGGRTDDRGEATQDWQATGPFAWEEAPG